MHKHDSHWPTRSVKVIIAIIMLLNTVMIVALGVFRFQDASTAKDTNIIAENQLRAQFKEDCSRAIEALHQSVKDSLVTAKARFDLAFVASLTDLGETNSVIELATLAHELDEAIAATEALPFQVKPVQRNCPNVPKPEL